MQTKSKLIGGYIAMLYDVIKSAEKFNNDYLINVARTERKAVIKNLDNPYRFSNFLESWENWGCPVQDDENWYFFYQELIGVSQAMAYDEYLDLKEGLYRER